MSWKSWAMVLGVCALSTQAPLAHASDRKDGTVTPPSAVISDPSVDIVDVFAWMEQAATPKYIYLAMTVYPDAVLANKFSTNAYYVFHTNAKAAYKDSASQSEVNVICGFDAAQTIECWVVGPDKSKLEYVKGNANQRAGIASRSGALRVFAGLRNDPFYFNETGFKKVLTDNATTIDTTPDTAGCPAVPLTNRTTANTTLKTPTNNDDFKLKNVLAIVVQVNTSLITSTTRPIVSVWASTNKKL